MNTTIHFGAVPVSPDDFNGRVARAASALRELGVGPGRVIALMLHNEPVLLELMLAARWVGAYYCLINWHFKAGEVRHILQDSGAQVLVVHANLLEQVREGIPQDVRVFVAWPHARTREAFGLADTAALAPGHETWEAHRDAGPRLEVAAERPGSPMLYTSGTTGLPKGILRDPPTPQQVEMVARMARLALGIEPGMRALVSAPMYHAAPSSYVLQAALNDAHLWLEPRFDAQATLRLIESERITHAYLVPTMFRRLLRLPPEVRKAHDLASMRFVACTGAPCPVDIKQQMIEWWGPVINESYAASELGYVATLDSHEALRKPGSAGRALPDTQIRIVLESGEEASPGQVGLIYARNDAVADFTYSRNADARRQLESEGLWTLGDMGYLDADGFLFIVDRKSDMVISGGVNIYPAEIESVLVLMPGVADGAVFGVPDEEFGESLLAAVQPVEGITLTAAQVQDFLRERLAGYKVPRHVVFHAQLPREDTGKIFKRRLRDPYWEGRTRRV